MFEDHLEKSKVTYLQHLRWAVTAGFKLIWAGFSSIIHGVFPNVFDGVAPKTVIEIYHNHLINHPNKDYQVMIEEVNKNDDKVSF